MEPNARFKRYKIDDTIIFFGSARILPRDEAERRLAVAKEEGAKEEDADLVVAERNLEMSRYYEATRELARRLTAWSKSLPADDRRFVVCSRSEERRVGTECVSPCRSRGEQYHEKKKKKT